MNENVLLYFTLFCPTLYIQCKNENIRMQLVHNLPCNSQSQQQNCVLGSVACPHNPAGTSRSLQKRYIIPTGHCTHDKYLSNIAVFYITQLTTRWINHLIAIKQCEPDFTIDF